LVFGMGHSRIRGMRFLHLSCISKKILANMGVDTRAAGSRWCVSFFVKLSQASACGIMDWKDTFKLEQRGFCHRQGRLMWQCISKKRLPHFCEQTWAAKQLTDWALTFQIEVGWNTQNLWCLFLVAKFWSILSWSLIATRDLTRHGCL